MKTVSSHIVFTFVTRINNRTRPIKFKLFTFVCEKSSSVTRVSCVQFIVIFKRFLSKLSSIKRITMQFRLFSLIILLGISSYVIPTTNGKLHVGIYYESLCPDSIRFITDQLFPGYSVVKHLIDVLFVPFGKSSVSQSSTVILLTFS